MGYVLDLFDFEGTGDAQQPAEQIPDINVELAIEKAENAAVVGNITLLAEALTDLRTLRGSRQIGNALYLAVHNRHSEIVEYLLAAGILITPEAATEATTMKDRQMLDLLLRHGWDINESLDLTIPSALALAVEDAALTSWLLERGASPNAQYLLDLTPLSIAVQFSSMPIIRALFDHGGSILYGQLTHYAVRRNLPDQLEVLDFILSKKPPINHVMYQDHLESYYRQRMFSLGTPLHEAAEKGKLDMVKKLLEAGAHPLIKDSRGAIPLQRAQMAMQDAVVAHLSPITAKATWPPYQFTEGKETTGWS